MNVEFKAELNLPEEIIDFYGDTPYEAVTNAFLYALLRSLSNWTIRLFEPVGDKVRIYNALTDSDIDEVIQRMNEYYEAGTNEGEYKDFLCAVEEVITNKED